VSGSELLGPLPARWSCRPLRLVGRLLKGTGGSKEDVVEEGIPCVRYGDLYTTHNNFIEQARTYLTPERARDYTPIEYGDVLFAASGETIEEIGKSAVNLLHGACCGGDVVILRPSEPTVARFLGYATDAAPVAAQKSLAGRGSTVKHIYPDELRDVVIAIPPLEEQQAIADFLDRETARIDALVTAKQRVLNLLAEKRKAIIATAVTRGLDPKVKLRDSGVPWLGEIPAHWEVSRLKFEATDIVDCLHATPPYDPSGEFPAIRTADVEPGRLLLDQARRLHTADYRRWTERLAPAEGDILYTREGERFGIAANVPANVPLCISQRMMLFRIRPDRDSAYFMWQLNSPSVYQQASEDQLGTAAPHVNVEKIKNFWMLVPPLVEQRDIVDDIARATEKLDAVRAATERTIALLKERRSALIAAAVTGQLDVGAAA